MLEYKNNKHGDFWERFRDAKPHSIPLDISDVNSFAALSLINSLGYNQYSHKFGSCLGFWSELCSPCRSFNTWPLTRYVYVYLLKNAEKCRLAHLYVANQIEKAALENSQEQLDVYVQHYVDAIKDFITCDSLWFDQKVYICFSAAKKIFFPNRTYTVTEKRWDRSRTYQHDENVKYYKHGWWHQYLMSQNDWESGGRETVSDAIVEAYLRELKELDVDKIDFNPFRPLFGADYNRVLEMTKFVLVASEVRNMNGVLASLRKGVERGIAEEKKLYVNLRDPVRLSFHTCDEEINVIVWEQQSWRRHKVDMAVGSFLSKILR